MPIAFLNYPHSIHLRLILNYFACNLNENTLGVGSLVELNFQTLSLEMGKLYKN